MKFNNILLFAAIASILTLNAFADSKTITTQGYVDAQDALKQDLIDADMMEYEDTGISFPTVVSYDSTDGVTGTKYGILDDVYSHWDELTDDGWLLWPEHPDQWLVSMDAADALAAAEVRGAFESRIPASGTTAYDENTSVSGGGAGYWLDNNVKGVSLVTRTTNDGFTGERKIFEESDVANYNTGTAQQKQANSISIPTMGAVMAAISNNQVTLPTGTAGNVVTYNSNGAIGGSVATYNGSGTYNASTDAGKIATAAAVETKQNKMTCTRWLDNAEHTDANCLLWSIN